MEAIEQEKAQRLLLRILQRAYSGELAAALAYQGHGRAVRDPDQRRRIAEIEQDEWRHREQVGEMLASLGGRPSTLREARMGLTGRVISFLCTIGGWLIPMYGAGRIERQNVGEYETAARLAQRAGQAGLTQELLHMAEVEWDHERYFRELVETSRFGRKIPLWPELPPRSAIRASFEAREGPERQRVTQLGAPIDR